MPPHPDPLSTGEREPTEFAANVFDPNNLLEMRRSPRLVVPAIVAVAAPIRVAALVGLRTPAALRAGLRRPIALRTCLWTGAALCIRVAVLETPAAI